MTEDLHTHETLPAPKLAPRQPMLAFLLSFILPGLGQLYNGDVNKFAWFLLLFAGFSVPAIAFVVLYLPENWTMVAMLCSVGLSILVWLAGLLDAWRSASRKRDYQPHAWQGGGVYLLVLVACTLVVLPLLTQYVRTHWIEAFRIPSSSMEPTVIVGDFIFADKRYNCSGCEHKVRRGDVVIFVYPNDRTVKYIKRVIALPGDHVRVKGEAVFVNGQSISGKPSVQNGLAVVQEGYEQAHWVVVWKDRKRPLPQSDLTVPVGEAFMMGDNRTDSNDSRFFGTVPLQDVFGKAQQIWLSYNRQLGGLQLDRSGKQVR